MLHPTGVAGGTGTGNEAVFEGSMLSLDHPVALRVIGSSQPTGDAQGGGQFTPQVTSELSAPVRDNGFRGPKTGHPVP